MSCLRITLLQANLESNIISDDPANQGPQCVGAAYADSVIPVLDCPGYLDISGGASGKGLGRVVESLGDLIEETHRENEVRF